ncbi:MAG: thiamine-phosphate kinase [Pseudomonadales bacterium]
MNEFELIEKIVALLGDTTHGDGVDVGPGDDAALLSIDADEQLVVTTDVVIEGTHFPPRSRGDLVGYRAVAVNLSDIAAMGANPRFVTVALTFDRVDDEWLEGFAKGVAFCASKHGVKVVGGNIARGSLSVAVTAIGVVPGGQSLLRSTARSGDDIYVTGIIGAASAAVRDGVKIPELELEELLLRRVDDMSCRYFLPVPQLKMGIALRGVASAAIDISDGLVADLGHLTRLSGVGAEIELGSVPVWKSLDSNIAINASDDYELLFTAPPQAHERIMGLAAEVSTDTTRIGKVTDGEAVMVNGVDHRVALPKGYRHF